MKLNDTNQNSIVPVSHSKIALCLSGGGLRATFFHLGVIRFLRQAKLLENVTQISSVSGGSILAGHLVLNWEKYTGSDDDYAAIEKDLINFGARDIRGRIVRRWVFSIVLPILRIFPSIAHRTFLLEKEYTRFFRDARLRDIEPRERKRPVLHLLATSFTTGNLCSFSGEGFWIHHDTGSKLYRTGIMPLALAVASSSAFPPLFPPTAITRKMLDASDEELPYDPEFLTDGGIFDNLGAARFSMRLADDQESPIDYLILSDAGGQLDWDIKGRFARVISRTIRSTDILMQRVADFTIGNARPGIDKGTVFHVPMSKIVLPKEFSRALLVDFQKKLPRIRTDLNRFTATEIGFLTHHGYEVAWSELSSLRPKDFEATNPEAIFVAELPRNQVVPTLNSLDRARTRRLGVFNAQDWISFALFAYLMLAVSVATFPYLYVARKAAQGELFKSTPVLVPFLTDRTRDSANVFGEGRASDLSSGWSTVHIPGEHKIGALELPPEGLFSFVSRAKGVFSVSDQTVNGSLTAAPTLLNSKQALIFVHGANTSLATAIMRTGQIVWDTRYPGSWVTYSWPSKEGSLDYLYDRDSAEISSINFPRIIRLLQDEAKIEKLDVITQGMGAALLLNAANQAELSISWHKKIFGEIIFVLPDIDRDFFAARVVQLVPFADRITLVTSTNSTFLRAAEAVSGSRRAGDGRTPLEIPNVDTVRINEEEVLMGIHGTSNPYIDIIGPILSRVPTRSISRLKQVDNSTVWDWSP